MWRCLIFRSKRDYLFLNRLLPFQKYPSPLTIRPQCRPAPKKGRKRRKILNRESSLPKGVDITDACKLTSKLNDIKPSLLPAPPTSLDLSPSLPPPPPPHFPPPMFAPPPPPPPLQFAPSSSLPVNVQRKDAVESAPVEKDELVTSGMLRTAKTGLRSRAKQQASHKHKQGTSSCDTVFVNFVFFFFRLLPSRVATADFPFRPMLCILIRNFRHCHVLCRRIREPPFRPSPFPLSWRFNPQHPDIPIIFPPYMSNPPKSCLSCFLSKPPSHLCCPSDVLIPDLVHYCHS